MNNETSLRIQIKVIPGATRTGIEWLGDKLKIKVNVAPENGRANVAVATLLAERLGLANNAVSIVAGHTNALKTVGIKGCSLDQLQQAIARKSV